VEFNDLRDPGGDEFMAQYLLARVQTRISVLTAQMGTLVHSTPFRVQQIVFVAPGRPSRRFALTCDRLKLPVPRHFFSDRLRCVIKDC
jgi:hypothetical protein